MPTPTPAPDLHRLSAVVLCRGGLEPVVAAELEALGIEVTGRRKRAVEILTDLGGIYRANMGLRSALNVLRPIRSFNARNYDLLYYQSRKTNWHKLFPVDARIRIDVKGHSPKITHTRYAIHRVKDGITDTFRKLCDGARPSIDKRDPDVHVVLHLEKHRATLALDTSGTPLFKRGYRTEHGEAPIKEDLAAGLLALSGWDRRSPLLDPMCGAGTLLFEGWMMAAGIAPNLRRRFGFEALLDYDRSCHEAERERLIAGECRDREGLRLLGLEIDERTFHTAQRIRDHHFGQAPVELRHADFREADLGADPWTVVCNPPYGMRSGEEEDIGPLYKSLGEFLRGVSGGCAGIYTANHEAAPLFGGRSERSVALLNGSLEGRLYQLDL